MEEVKKLQDKFHLLDLLQTIQMLDLYICIQRVTRVIFKPVSLKALFQQTGLGLLKKKKEKKKSFTK